jgi:hypothetical protein
MESTATDATTSKQLDMFFKDNVVFFVSGDIALFRRLFLAIVKSL